MSDNPRAPTFNRRSDFKLCVDVH